MPGGIIGTAIDARVDAREERDEDVEAGRVEEQHAVAGLGLLREARPESARALGELPPRQLDGGLVDLAVRQVAGLERVRILIGVAFEDREER